MALERKSISKIKRGDQVAVPVEIIPVGNFKHHAIVEEVDPEQGLVHAVGFNKTGDVKVKGRVKREVFDVKKNPDIWVVDHSTQPFSTETVVARAQERLGEGGYDLFRNNCEHFAAYCKKGKAECRQLKNLGFE